MLTGTPIGDLLLTADADGALTSVLMESDPQDVAPHWEQNDDVLATARKQLEEYFAGERIEFDLDLAPSGTQFQQRVWEALNTIPYGEVRSYGQIADQIGNPTAARAVGLANGRNPIAVVVPCHRVIGASGSLTGYGGGLERKRYLLDLEESRNRPTLLP
jgi:methylated-DNA-[protein]-cysteine S-methyltransferase